MAEPRPAALDLRIDGLISVCDNTTISHGTIFNRTLPVVIKEITYEETSAANQALREAMMQKRLEHANVCKLYDCYLQRDGEEMKVVLVMERLGSDVKQEIERRKRARRTWEERELLQAAKEMISALAYAQTSGIAHRDIKPENIFLDGSHYKLGDFGSSVTAPTGSYLPSSHQYSSPESFHQFLTASSKETTEVHASLPGNLQYASPEYRLAMIKAVSQGSVHAAIDVFKADVYSLGLVIAEMALLEFPEEAKDVMQLERRLPGCIGRVVQLYPGLVKVLSAMLSVGAQERPRFTELAKMFETAQKSPVSVCKTCGKAITDREWTNNLNSNMSKYREECASLCSEECLNLSIDGNILCVGCGEQFPAQSLQFVQFPCPDKHVFHSLECVFEHICTLTVNFSNPSAPYTCPCCKVRVIKENVMSLFETTAWEALRLEAYQNSCFVCHQSTNVWKCKNGHLLCKSHQYTVFWKTKCPICNNKTKMLTA